VALALYERQPVKSRDTHVLRLLPAAAENAQLISELRVVALDSSPEYVALSNDRGGQPIDHSICLDENMLDVIASCCQVLRKVRRLGWQFVLIDQLSIDQTNL
jgi:hypothetical protein